MGPLKVSGTKQASHKHLCFAKSDVLTLHQAGSLDAQGGQWGHPGRVLLPSVAGAIPPWTVTEATRSRSLAARVHGAWTV